MLTTFAPGKPGPIAAGLLDRLDEIAARLAAAGKTNGDVGAALKRLIHSPAVALLVRLSPTPADDAALELLKALFPAT